MPANEDVAAAVVARMAHQFSIDVDPAEIDRGASLFTGGAFSLGGFELHSLELVEALTALEDEVGLPLLDEHLSRLDTVDKLAALIAGAAEPDRLAAFCERWAPVPR